MMKIITKVIKKDESESIVYLVDDNGNPLKASIVSKNEKEETINNLLAEYFTPSDWVNNKTNLLEHVEEVSYEEYIKQ